MAYRGDRVIAGAKNSGKSTLGRWYFEHHEGPRIWWDPSGDFAAPPGSTESGPDSEETAFRRTLEAGLPVVWRAGALTDDRIRRQIAVLLMMCEETGASLFGDEAHLFMPQGRPHPKVMDAQLRGRHWGPPGDNGEPVGISVYLMSPRVQLIDKNSIQVGGGDLDIFHSPIIKPWLQRNGLDPRGAQLLAEAPPHSWITYRSMEHLEGPFTLHPVNGPTPL